MGVYGVLSYTVTQRREELSIRMALGAAPGSVRWFVVRSGMRLVVLGVFAGAVGAYWSSRFLSSVVYGVGVTGLATYAGVAALVGGVALVSCALPAYQHLGWTLSPACEWTRKDFAELASQARPPSTSVPQQISVSPRDLAGPIGRPGDLQRPVPVRPDRAKEDPSAGKTSR